MIHKSIEEVFRFFVGTSCSISKSIKEAVKIYYRIYSAQYVNGITFKDRLVWLPDCLMLDFIAFPVIITSGFPSYQLHNYDIVFLLLQSFYHFLNMYEVFGFASNE